MPETGSAKAGAIAYLTGEYPRATDTFIQREVAGLRDLGREVLTCTVRRPSGNTLGSGPVAAEAARTFCILDTARTPHRLIAAHLAEILHAPGRWFSALRLAWQTRPPGGKALVWQLFYFAEAGILARHLRRNRVVHLHNHFGDSSGSVAMLASAISGIPFSITLHGPAIFFEPVWWRIDAKIARARFIACISHFCRSQAMAFSDPAQWGKLRIVHCGVVPELYGTRPRPAFSGHVLFVGRLDPVKGVPLLLEAFAAALTRHPQARLTVVGDGPARSALEAEALAQGIAARVRFLGYQSQEAVAALLDEADMLVLPSFAEGLPVVLMEAMASQIPVIATQVAGVPELVQDGISGFIVPPGDVETLAARLDQLLSDPDLCARMGQAGRLKVEAEHDIRTEVAWLHALFEGAARGLRPEARSGKGGM